MPRARMLSRSISTSVSIESMSEWAQLLFDRLVIWTDDFGRIEADPRFLKATIKPLSNRAADEFASAVAEMIGVGAVVAYAAGGKALLHVVKNDEHQRVSKKTPSRYPAPDGLLELSVDQYLTGVWGDAPEIARDCPGKSYPREVKRKEEKPPYSPPSGGPDPAEADSSSGAAQSAAGQTRKTRKKTATHMLPEWQPDAEWIERLRAEYPAVDVSRVVPEFRDWWIGDGGAKANWNATLSHWMRKVNTRIRSGERQAIAAYGIEASRTSRTIPGTNLPRFTA